MVATAGQGILRSNDDGQTWHRLGLKEAIEFDGVVRALAVHPSRPERVYAGADCGLCISDDGGAHWRRAQGAVSGMTVWSIAIDPNDARVLYAGTGAPSRSALFKSTDAGETWSRLPPEMPEFCQGVNRPRMPGTVCVEDIDNHFADWMAVHPGPLIVLRPDRYIAAHCDAAQLPEVTRRFAQFTVPASQRQPQAA